MMSESYCGLSLESFRSPLVSAAQYRKALQLATKALGATKGNLINQIKTLHEDGLLPDSMKDMAHQIRLIGNAAAHDDPLPEGEAKAEAEDIREFAELFMTYLFTLPARIESRQANDEAGED